MLVLKRKEGQWIEVIHRSGDVMRVRVYNIRVNSTGQADLAFDDPVRNFEIRRPERIIREPFSQLCPNDDMSEPANLSESAS